MGYIAWVEDLKNLQYIVFPDSLKITSNPSAVATNLERKTLLRLLQQEGKDNQKLLSFCIHIATSYDFSKMGGINIQYS